MPTSTCPAITQYYIKRIANIIISTNNKAEKDAESLVPHMNQP